MSSAYISHHEFNIDKSTTIIQKNQAVAGLPIGILVADSFAHILPGNVVNANTYNFPVIYKVLKGISAEQIMTGDSYLLETIIKGGKELIQHGVRAVVGACGSFAFYQREVASALEVPTFLSVMLQVPLIVQSLKPEQKVGILAASAATITQKVFDQCRISDPSRLVIFGAETLSQFDKLFDYSANFDSNELERELVNLLKQIISENQNIGALLIQCSDLPPYAWAIQNATGLPVFDMNSLIEWVHYAIVRKPYYGFI